MNKKCPTLISLLSFFLLIVPACISAGPSKGVTRIYGIATLEVVGHFEIRVVRDKNALLFLHDKEGKPVDDLTLRVGESFYLSDNAHIGENYQLVGLKLSVLGNSIMFRRVSTFDARSFGGDVKKTTKIITVKLYEDKQKEVMFYPEGKPVIVLVVYNPWAEVIGSDSASFALYEDGLAIFGNPFLHVRMSPANMQNFLSGLPINEFSKLEDHYEIGLETDQPTYVIHVWKEGKRKTVTIYGYPRSRDPKPIIGHLSEAPDPFLKIYDALVSYRHRQAKLWLPKKIEVMLWPFEYAKGEPLVWPKDWPGLNHSETKRRRDAYSIYLDSFRLDDLRKFFSQQNEGGSRAVLVGGKKWAISYRFPIPFEELWMRK